METVFTDITDYLLNQSQQIAILFAVVAIICMAIRKKTAHLRYLLWLLIIAKCLVPSLITVSLAILPQKPLLQPLPESSPIREFAPPPEPVILSEAKNLSPPEALAVHRPSIMAQLAQIPPKTWFSVIWLGGVSLYLIIVMIKAARFNHRLKGQRKRLTAGMQKEIDELLGRFGIGAKPVIWLLDGIGQPFVWGLLRGAIYLPANFGQIGSREHRRGILMHEIAHVARFDAAVNCLQTIAQAVFWFHPLVWWANRNIRAEREKCCDETAIARLNAAPRVYSSAIVDTLIAEYQSTQPIPSLAIAGPIKNIEDRIKTIMKPGKKFYNRPTIIAIVTILLLAIIAVPTTIALTHRQAEKPEEFLTKPDVQVEGEDSSINVANKSDEPLDVRGQKALKMVREFISAVKAEKYEIAKTYLLSESEQADEWPESDAIKDLPLLNTIKDFKNVTLPDQRFIGVMGSWETGVLSANLVSSDFISNDGETGQLCFVLGNMAAFHPETYESDHWGIEDLFLINFKLQMPPELQKESDKLVSKIQQLIPYINSYAKDHEGDLPDELRLLDDYGLDGNKLFGWPEWWLKVGYQGSGKNLNLADPSRIVVAHCSIGERCGFYRWSILYLDGHIEPWTKLSLKDSEVGLKVSKKSDVQVEAF